MLKLIYLIRNKGWFKKCNRNKLALKSNLVNLKAEIDKIDVDKLNTVPIDLIKVSHVVNNY